MTKQDIAIIKEAYHYFTTGDIRTFIKYLADDITFKLAGDTPLSKQVQGKANLIQLFIEVGQYLDGTIAFTSKRWIETGDWVISESEGEAKTKLGKIYRNSYCHLLHASNGKIDEFIEYADTHKIMTVLLAEA